MKNFEEQMEELEKIITELENGNLNLDDSVLKFEEGMKISKQCSKMLENAEKKITILLNDNGELKEEKFEVE
ncbi:MAG: exodeoxyribonuclease VII small subunit [Clostridia bacterium]